MGEESEREALAGLVRELIEQGVPDAVMLRRVMRLRDLGQEIDRELARMQRFFTGSAQTPPS